MRLTYDRSACQGHNRCYALAPELFDVDDEGYAILLVHDEIPVELSDKAALVVANCPEFAIGIAESETASAS
jgi:ferredoxin